MIFQEENELPYGHYCNENVSLITSFWGPVIHITRFASAVVIPFILIGHNYARIGRTLFQSVKKNLKEGNYTE